MLSQIMTDSELEKLFSALGNQLRLQILDLVAQHKEMCVCELVDELGMSQANVSHHMGILRDADLVEARKVGTWVFYRVNSEPLKSALTSLVGRLRTSLSQAADEEPEARVAARCGVSQ